MKFLVYLLLFGFLSANAQLPFNEEQFLARVKIANTTLPEKLLSTRTAVFATYNFTAKELETAQKTFQRTGIDAVAYFDHDLIYSGRDALVSLADYLNTREISNLVLLKKDQR